MTPAGRWVFEPRCLTGRAWACGFFPLGWAGFDCGAGVLGMGLAGRLRPLGSGSGQRGGEVSEQRRLGAGGGEGEADARRGFDDAGADFRGASGAAWRTRRRLARAPSGWRLGVRASVNRRRYGEVRVDRARSARKRAEPDLIGERRAAAGAIGGELALVQFDQVLGLSIGTQKGYSAQSLCSWRGLPVTLSADMVGAEEGPTICRSNRTL